MVVTKTQLDQIIKREAEKYADGFFDRHESASWLSEKSACAAGANLLAPALLEAIEALNNLACWRDGPVVTSTFDCPGDAELARETLERIEKMLGEK